MNEWQHALYKHRGSTLWRMEIGSYARGGSETRSITWRVTLCLCRKLYHRKQKCVYHWTRMYLNLGSWLSQL
jgi:hypothetical protein